MTKMIELTQDDSRLLKTIQDMAHPNNHWAEQIYWRNQSDSIDQRSPDLTQSG